MDSIKNDSVLGILKFVAKNEDNQVYGIVVIPKKARKGTKVADSPKKKDSFSADDNTIPDLDVALELGKSISKTEAEEHKEQRKVHETHERLVTAKPTCDEESDVMISQIKYLNENLKKN
nr:hypothetical protein [Tanacetum cinerariifolium]